MKCKERTIGISLWTLVVANLAAAPSAVAQTWISFSNETGARLANAAGESFAFASDPDEKDFAVGDVDNDGDDDLVLVRKQPYTTQGKRAGYLFINEGGVLTNETADLAPQLLTPTNSTDAQLFDADGDGWLDLLTTATFPSTPFPTADPPAVIMPRLYINLGADADGNWLGFSYTYSDQRIPDFPKHPFFTSATFGDFDGDGDDDLFFTDSASASTLIDPPGGPLKNRLLRNAGGGYFVDVTQTNLIASGAALMQGSGYGTRAHVADVDGDGDLDLMGMDSCSAIPTTVRLALNNGAGLFTTTVNYATFLSPWDFSLGDLNNDGKPDFWMARDFADRYFLNGGNNAAGLPQFGTGIIAAGQSAATTSGFGGQTYSVDLDGDGWLDQIVCDEQADASQNNNRMALFHNLGNAPTVTLTNAGDPLTLDGALGVRDTFDVAVLDLDGDTRLDLVIGGKAGMKVFMQPLLDTTPPTLVATNPPNGTRDNLQDRATGGALQGISQVTFTFSEPVRDAATNGALGPASFSVSLATNLSGLTPTTIAAVAPGAANAYVITLDHPITPGAWTTITANVEDLVGHPLAGGAIDLGFLPGDVNVNGTTAVPDLLQQVKGVNACTNSGTCSSPAVLAQYDANRDGQATPADAMRVLQLVNGVNTQNPWANVSLPAQP